MSPSRRAEVGSRTLWCLSGSCRGRGKCYSLLWQEVVLGIWHPSSHMPASRALLLLPLPPLFWKRIPSPGLLLSDVFFALMCRFPLISLCLSSGNGQSQRANLEEYDTAGIILCNSHCQQIKQTQQCMCPSFNTFCLNEYLICRYVDIDGPFSK